MERQPRNVLMPTSVMARRCSTLHGWRMGCWGMPFREVSSYIVLSFCENLCFIQEEQLSCTDKRMCSTCK